MVMKRKFMKPTSIGRGGANITYYQNGKPGTAYTMQPALAWENHFQVPCESLLNEERELFIREWVQGHFGPYGLVQEGSNTPLPTYRIDYGTVKSNNRAALAALKEDKNSIDIVVSEFARGNYTISQGYGSLDETVNPYVTATKSILMDPAVRKMGGSQGIPDNSISFNGLNWHKASSPCRIYYNEVVGSYDIAPSDVGFPIDDLKYWMDALPFTGDTKRDLVVNTLADANRGTVDLLTAIAEMPDLLRSILQGCRTIVRMYSDAKKRNLRFINKAKKLRLEYARSQADADFKDIKATEKHMQKLRTLELQIKEALDAAADVWLNWRLNIYPTAKTIEDSLKGLDQLDAKFIRYRNLEKEILKPPQFEGWETVGEFLCQHRCFIKRGAKPGDMFDQVFTSDIPSTLWQLIPFSFILDRYVDIGSWIASTITRDPKVTQGSTYSWKYSGTVTWKHIKSNATVTVDLSYYKRVVIDPNRLTCIPFPDSRSRNQHIDHIALAWKLLLNKTLGK